MLGNAFSLISLPTSSPPFYRQSTTRWKEGQAKRKSPSCCEHDGDRNLNHNEKALFCIIQQDGLEIKEEHYAERMEAEANRI